MDKGLYRTHFELQNRHWWFTSKRAIVLDLILRHRGKKALGRLLDIGCGTGLMLGELSKIGITCGMDMSPEAISFSKDIFSGEVKQGSLPNQVPYHSGDFDLITALDVIEHIDDDVSSLRAIARLLKVGGMAVLTVPAGMYLWSDHDVVNEHKRRYTRREFKSKILNAGFEIEKISYYNFFLLPLIYIARLANRLFKKSSDSDYALPNPVLNKFLGTIFQFEKPLLRIMSFPVGVSLLAVVRKVG